jgi:hypothetical protein
MTHEEAIEATITRTEALCELHKRMCGRSSRSWATTTPTAVPMSWRGWGTRVRRGVCEGCAWPRDAHEVQS